MAARLSSGCYLGQVLIRRNYDGLLLTETRHAHSDWLPTHAHENAYFCLIRRGQYSERYGRTQRLCRPSMLTFHPPEEQHSERIESEYATSFNIELEPKWLRWISDDAKLFLQSREVESRDQVTLAHRVYREYETNDSASSLAIHGLTMELLAGMIRARKTEPRIPPWLNRVRQLLHDRFQDRLEWQELAEVAGVHPVYLGQCFRKHFHCTPGDYLRKLRVEYAGKKMVETDTSLSAIALQAGFADQSHMTRHFKNYMGVTPLVYRRSR